MSTDLQTLPDVATAYIPAAQAILPSELPAFTELTDTAKHFAIEIVSFAKASTESTVAMCESFYKAKEALDDGEFSALCKAVNYKADSSTIKKYIVIGKKAGQFRPYLNRLPHTWTTLYEITHLNGDVFQQFVESGQINSATTGKDLKALVTRGADKTTKPIPRPRITLQLGDSMTKERIDSLISELQALSIEYKFIIESNVTALHPS